MLIDFKDYTIERFDMFFIHSELGTLTLALWISRSMLDLHLFLYLQTILIFIRYPMKITRELFIRIGIKLGVKFISAHCRVRDQAAIWIMGIQ